MHIAQIAPVAEAVPPERYGGTERVVHNLTEELVRRGHEVTLFATGDSHTSAHLEAVVPRGLRLAGVRDTRPFDLLALECAYSRAAQFDLIHSHIDYPTLPFARRCATPTVMTCHGRLDLLDIHPVYEHYQDVNLVSISDNQRRMVPHWPWAGTVYNGVNTDAFTFHARAGQYLAFLGRISPEKGIEEAISVALRAEVPLKVAAKVDPVDEAYFQGRVRPLLEHPLVEYIGEIDEQEKDNFLGGALGLLFPIRWPEPFGLVMAEALATGTPVIAARYGSVPEVIDDGETGFICDSEDEMVLGVRRLEALERRRCRTVAEVRFSAGRMAADYEAVYQRVLTDAARPAETERDATRAAG